MGSLNFPIPVVRLIITDDQNRVLLLQRSSGDFIDHWTLPGGKVDYGYRLEDVIRKELKEETNLELQSARFLFLQDNLPAEAGSPQFLNLYFECDWRGTVSLNYESSRFAWISGLEIDQYNIVFQNDEALRRYWETSHD